MMLLKVIGIFLATLLPLAQVQAAPFRIIPQEISWPNFVSQKLYTSNIATDPTHVIAGQGLLVSNVVPYISAAASGFVASIFTFALNNVTLAQTTSLTVSASPPPCYTSDQEFTYALRVENTSGASLTNTTTYYQPTSSNVTLISASPAPGPNSSSTRYVWQHYTVPADWSQTYQVTIRVTGTNDATFYYYASGSGKQSYANHTIKYCTSTPLPTPSASPSSSPTSFSSPPTSCTAPPPSSVSNEKLEIFLINKSVCPVPADNYTYRVLVRNEGNQLAQNLKIEVFYAPGGVLLETVRPANEIDLIKHKITWLEGALVPDAFVEYSFTILYGGGPLHNTASVEYDYPCPKYSSATQHTVDGVCEVPSIVSGYLPSKLAAIICDPSDQNCEEFLPGLGIRFPGGQDASKQPRLGVRYSQATPTILPGECRVAEDEAVDEFRNIYTTRALFGPPVETTICESDGYPQFVIREAPVPAKVRDIVPPDVSRVSGEQAFGAICSSQPGDPWWSSGCECQCGQLIDVGFGPTTCQSVFPITKHDISVTTKEQCLNE